LDVERNEEVAMRQLMVLLAGVVALLGVLSFSGQTTATASPPSSLQTASIPTVSGPPVKVPEPRFTRTMYAATQLPGAGVMLDACHGPIAVDLVGNWPVLIVQHDYCGGSAWIPKLNYGDAVRLKGDGVVAGTYVVTELRYQLRGKAKVRDMPAADAVLQTCVTKHKLVLVALDWVGA
jgi:hypothetical protein